MKIKERIKNSNGFPCSSKIINRCLYDYNHLDAYYG